MHKKTGSFMPNHGVYETEKAVGPEIIYYRQNWELDTRKAGVDG